MVRLRSFPDRPFLLVGTAAPTTLALKLLHPRLLVQKAFSMQPTQAAALSALSRSTPGQEISLVSRALLLPLRRQILVIRSPWARARTATFFSRWTRVQR